MRSIDQFTPEVLKFIENGSGMPMCIVKRRSFMDVSSIGAGSAEFAGQSDSVQSDRARTAFMAARMLNNLNVPGREFSTVWDSTSQRFKVVVLDGETGAVLDQYPPEEVLKMLAQISPAARRTGDTAE
jgi:uncharacterized FlaG/YvyC family protein